MNKNRPGLIIQFFLFLFAAVLALSVVLLNQGTSSDVPQGKGKRSDIDILSLFKPQNISEAFRQKLLYPTPKYATPYATPAPADTGTPMSTDPNAGASAAPQGAGGNIQYTTPPADG